MKKNIIIDEMYKFPELENKGNFLGLKKIHIIDEAHKIMETSQEKKKMTDFRKLEFKNKKKV